VPELFLHGFEVGAGGVGLGRGAVAEVVQPHGWEAGSGDEVAEPAGEPVRVQRCAVVGGQFDEPGEVVAQQPVADRGVER
jgi:hypothetical protein